jgi:hypothetical protein
MQIVKARSASLESAAASTPVGQGRQSKGVDIGVGTSQPVQTTSIVMVIYRCSDCLSTAVVV